MSAGYRQNHWNGAKYEEERVHAPLPATIARIFAHYTVSFKSSSLFFFCTVRVVLSVPDERCTLSLVTVLWLWALKIVTTAGRHAWRGAPRLPALSCCSRQSHGGARVDDGGAHVVAARIRFARHPGPHEVNVILIHGRSVVSCAEDGQVSVEDLWTGKNKATIMQGKNGKAPTCSGSAVHAQVAPRLRVGTPCAACHCQMALRHRRTHTRSAR